VVLSGANWFFVVWQIGCALAKNIETLIVCRLFAGIGGSACITLGAGVVADLFPTELRGMATSIWSMGPLIGPVVGPIAGGFLGEEVSWQWIFWLLLIAGGAMQIGIELLNKETYAPVLIKWKTAKLAKELGRADLKSAYDLGSEPLSNSQLLRRSLIRPALLLFKSPIVLLLSIYMVSIIVLFCDEVTRRTKLLIEGISRLSTVYSTYFSRPSPMSSRVHMALVSDYLVSHT
jgi:MFS family permease